MFLLALFYLFIDEFYEHLLFKFKTFSGNHVKQAVISGNVCINAYFDSILSSKFFATKRCIDNL